MKKLFVIGLLAAGIATSWMQLPSIAADAPTSTATDKSTKTVTLKHTDADYLMYILSIDQKTGKPANKQTPASQEYALTGAGNMVPQGIESVTAAKKNSLVITGKTADVETFAATIASMDVKPKQVQIKTEIYEMPTSKVKTFFMDKNQPIGNIYPITADMKTAMVNAGAKLLNAPIISTLNNMPAQLSIKTMIPDSTKADGKSLVESNINLFVTPRVNTDNTVTLYVNLEIPYMEKLTITQDGKSTTENKTKSIGVTLCRRVNNKEPVLAFVDTQQANNGKQTFVVITPTVID